MNCKSKYFCFHPTTYIKSNINSIFIYNTINSRHYTIKNKELVEKINNNINNYNSSFNVSISDQPTIDELISGEYGNTFESNSKVFIPYAGFAKVESNIEIIQNTDIRHLGSLLSTNLLELNFIYSDFFNKENVSSRQDLCAHNSSYTDSLEFNKVIDGFIDLIDYLPNLCRINFYTNDTNGLENINALIRQSNISNYTQIHCSASFYKNNKSSFQSTTNNLYIFNRNDLTNLDETYSSCKFILCLKNQEDYEYCINILDVKGLDYDMKAYVDNNHHFFEEFVFTEKQDILRQNRDIKEIISNRIINRHDFGKLFIDMSCNYSTNLYANIIGNTKNKSIQEILISCYGSDNSTWFLTRNKLKVCNICKYNELCPPLTGYEFLFDRNDLCNINDRVN